MIPVRQMTDDDIKIGIRVLRKKEDDKWLKVNPEEWHTIFNILRGGCFNVIANESYASARTIPEFWYVIDYGAMWE